MPTTLEPFEIVDEDEPTRVIRGVVERPVDRDQESLPWVIALHGFKGFMDWGFFPLLSRGLAKSGMACVRFNASGCGVGEDGVDFSDLESFEKDTYGRQLEDIERVRDLANAGGLGMLDPGRCGLFGHSRGGGASVLHAADHPCQAMVLWAAIDRCINFPEPVLVQWRQEGHLDIENARTGQTMRVGGAALAEVDQNSARFDIVEAAARVACPSLVVHGTADESVPFASAKRIHTALPDSHLLAMEEAGHTFGAEHPLLGMNPALERVLSRSLEHLAENLL
jgi:uncharacterized protein